MGKKKGKSAKKARQGLVVQETEELLKAPHSFVIYRGKIGRNCGDLMRDFRKVMEPFTASQLKVMKQNVVKDFVSVAGLLNVTHLVVFTKTELGMYVRIARLPRGPTLTFQIKNYSLAKDVLSSLKKRVTYAKQFEHHPLLVLNNFSGEGIEMKLMSSMLQNMFPSINVNKVNLNTIRRCVLFNYNPDDKTIDFRHYTIKAVPCGISKAVKKLIQSKVPDLSKFEDVSEFIAKSGNLSESEAEMDTPLNQVVLPQNLSSRGNMAFQKSAIRLIELGPRLSLQLMKVEEGLMDGEVLYHMFVKKTQQEIESLRLQRQKKKKLKKKRRETQEENMRLKEEQKQLHKEKSLRGMKKDGVNDDPIDEDDDAQWYEKELGEKPDTDLFPNRKMGGGLNTKRKATADGGPTKKDSFPNRKTGGGLHTKWKATADSGPTKKDSFRHRKTGGGLHTKRKATTDGGPTKKDSFSSRKMEGDRRNKRKATTDVGPAKKKPKFGSRTPEGRVKPKKRTRSLQEILKKRKTTKEKRKKKSVTFAKTLAVRKHMRKFKDKK